MIKKFVLPCLLAFFSFLVSCNPFESKTEAAVEEETQIPEWIDFERGKLLNDAYAKQYKQSPQQLQAQSIQGVLRLSPALNNRITRAQVILTRNGYLPAFDVSGATGVGIANGFQWINFGKNESGIYNAGQPLSAFPIGKLGGAVWLVSGDTLPPFAADGNLVVKE
jgi:hypothetical protein